MIESADTVHQLRSDSSLLRARAFMELAHEHDPSIGDALVEALLKEADPHMFGHVIDFVLPRWISLFATKIEHVSEWNLDAERTSVILLGRHGMRIKPMETHLTKWIQSDNFALALAALNYCGTWDILTGEAWESYQKLRTEMESDPEHLIAVERIISVGVEPHPVRFLRNLEAMLNPEAVDLSAEFLDDEDE
jgi:hypothetical protein